MYMLQEYRYQATYDFAGAVVFSVTTWPTPLTRPNMSSTAGMTWATTIKAQKPRKIQTKNPLSSTLPPAANAATGAKPAIVAMVVISALMTSSYVEVLFVVFVFDDALAMPNNMFLYFYSL